MKSLVTALLLFFPTSLFSQTWTYTTTVGPQGDISDFRTGSALVYSAPKDDELSTWQDLPFPFHFGEEEVNGYFISDNGYITFDASATVSEGDNAGGDVRNAIFAFWDDLFLEGGNSVWTNEVRTKTFGAAPDRRHIVMWISVVPKGSTYNSARISFALALYEKGGFEIVHIAGQPGRNTNGTIGVVDATGQVKTLLPGSPDIEFPPLTADPGDDIRYIFTWSESARDLALESIDVPSVVRMQQPVTIAGTLRNVGSELIESYRLTYSIDGSSEHELYVDGLNLHSNQTMRYVHPVTWTPAAGGQQHTITVRIHDVNGDSDENPDNDVLSMQVFTNLGITSPKRVLVEEFTGTWCGWCPDGLLQLERLLDTWPDAVAYTIHAGGGDRMIIPEGSDLAREFTPSYPTAMIDRVKFEGEKGVPVSRGGEAWVQRTGQRRTVYSPLSVSVIARRGAVPDEVTATIRMEFSDYAPPGDYRLHCFLIHDKRKGSGPGWDQANYYSGNASFPNHPFYSLPNPVPNFEHRHVLSASATGVWGDETVLPASPAANSQYEKTYTFSYPADAPDENLSVVAFVSRHAENVLEREVLNAASSAPLALSLQQADLPHPGIISLHPQPANALMTAYIQAPSFATLRVDVYDVLGRLRYSGIERGTDNGLQLRLPTAGLENGAYLLRVSSGMEVFQRAFVVMR